MGRLCLSNFLPTTFGPLLNPWAVHISTSSSGLLCHDWASIIFPRSTNSCLFSMQTSNVRSRPGTERFSSGKGPRDPVIRPLALSRKCLPSSHSTPVQTLRTTGRTCLSSPGNHSIFGQLPFFLSFFLSTLNHFVTARPFLLECRLHDARNAAFHLQMLFTAVSSNSEWCLVCKGYKITVFGRKEGGREDRRREGQYIAASGKLLPTGRSREA